MYVATVRHTDIILIIIPCNISNKFLNILVLIMPTFQTKSNYVLTKIENMDKMKTEAC